MNWRDILCAGRIQLTVISLNVNRKGEGSPLILIHELVVDQSNGKTSKAIMNWFGNFVTISGLRHERNTGVTFSL